MSPAFILVLTFVCGVGSAKFLWRKPCPAPSPTICLPGQMCVLELPYCGRLPCRQSRRRCVFPREKPGKCPVAPPGVVTTCEVKCSADAWCPGAQKCCQFGCKRQCMDPAPVVKPGTCPVTPPGIVTTCGIYCRSDAVCLGRKKCCQFGCAVQCMEPKVPLIKPGSCPSQSVGNATAADCGAEPCSSDDMCPGKQKCCGSGCAAQCRNPAGEGNDTCPDKTLEIGQCYSFCKNDTDCPTGRKCCGECFRYCAKPKTLEHGSQKSCPITPPNAPEPEVCETRCPAAGCPDGELCCGKCGGRCTVPVHFKAGKCPSSARKSVCPGGAQNECLEDASCLNDQKCCSNGCILKCTAPH